MIVDLTSQILAEKENKTLNKPFRTPGGPKKFSVNPSLAFADEEDTEIDDGCGCGGCGCESQAAHYEMSEEEYKEAITIEDVFAARPGPKSAAQTPSKPSEINPVAQEATAGK